MAYSRSIYRNDFQARIDLLLSASRKANRLPVLYHDTRDMVFQCAIFQTSAALESYLRLIVESWFQEIKGRSLGASLPDNVRGYLALRRFGSAFERYLVTKDDITISSHLGKEKSFWSLMTGAAVIPSHIRGADIYDGAAYPSYKNIKKLFARFGVPNVHDRISIILKRDVETMIESFQSIRTALAHAAPPVVTIADVRDRLSDMSDLVRALDRIMHQLVNLHGGSVCWK